LDTGFKGDRTIKLFYNGLVRNPGKSPVQAVAVEGTRIKATGDNDGILALEKPGDTRINLRGRLLVPGFSDSHIHMLMTGGLDEQLSLHGVKSEEEILERAKTYMAERRPKPEEWIVGIGFDQTAFTRPCMPDRRLADRISRSNPVLLFRVYYHTAVVNSAALARLDLGQHWTCSITRLVIEQVQAKCFAFCCFQAVVV
jgi:predicted amidohydrolase YtcJ